MELSFLFLFRVCCSVVILYNIPLSLKKVIFYLVCRDRSFNIGPAKDKSAYLKIGDYLHPSLISHLLKAKKYGKM